MMLIHEGGVIFEYMTFYQHVNDICCMMYGWGELL